jgi:hypothetical protein
VILEADIAFTISGELGSLSIWLFDLRTVLLQVLFGVGFGASLFADFYTLLESSLIASDRSF